MSLQNEAQLDDLLSEPTPDVIETLARLPGDLLLLGVAGKMGPTLARMARRASDAAGVSRRVIGVARFSAGGEAALRKWGIETFRCDLLNEADVARLPDAPSVLFMAGRKFGSTGDEPATWALNSYLPSVVCQRYRDSRIVAFSTGNVYGLVPVAGGGSREDDRLNPVGEYAMSCLGRERMFEYFSGAHAIPTALIRLNYACELRYGVLVDLALKVRDEQPIDLSMGHFNVIWQGDANALTLRAFEQCAVPAVRLNLTGPDVLSVRAVCEELGQLMNRVPRFVGRESDTALLSDARGGLERLGQPRVPVKQLIAWVADWTLRGGPLLGKPTHFESRDGEF